MFGLAVKRLYDQKSLLFECSVFFDRNLDFYLFPVVHMYISVLDENIKLFCEFGCNLLIFFRKLICLQVYITFSYQNGVLKAEMLFFICKQ